MNSGHIRVVEVHKIPQPEVSLELKVPKFCLANRKVRVKVTVKNDKDHNYPQDNAHLIVDVYNPRVGAKKVVTSLPATRNHSSPFRLKPKETREFTFSLSFKEPGLYEVHARVRKVEILEVRGEPKWDDDFVILSSGDTITLAGLGWQTVLKKIGGTKTVTRIIKCMSLYDVLLLLGAISAIISAVCGVLSLLIG
ncbi:hypothetical protein DRN44_01845 [Thermococci archaeon]|nr:MAG: hypothetical protein DRN44_01845 [Thermococci archaeon]